MNPRNRRSVSITLVVAVACASAGCATTEVVRDPTPESVFSHVQVGDRLEVVTKDGLQRTVQVAQVGTEQFQVGFDGETLRYDAIAQMRVCDDGTTYEGRQGSAALRTTGAAVGAVALVVVAPVAVLLGLCGLASSSRHW